MAKLTMDKLVALCKSRGFIFQGSEIYGGLANAWDYGPLGVELKNNIKQAWWKKFVRENEYNVGLDAAVLMNPAVWEASGHLSGFTDPLMDCKACKARHRADELIEAYAVKNKAEIDVNGWSNEKMEKFIAEKKIKCPVCGNCDFTGVRKFNLMFRTFQGVTEDSADALYLRPETAQGIFVNFANVQRSVRARIPFGVAQTGKSFRNEITPGNFIFRTREFEQMELEFFCKPGTDGEWFEYWKNFCEKWLLDLNIKKENLRQRNHSAEELSFYSSATTDFEYKFPFGWGELWGIADRTDYDLKAHSKKSGKTLDYTDPATGEKYVPYVIEPSLGVERTALAFLCDAYDEETLDGGDARVVLRLHPALAPIKIAVLPLQKQLSERAKELWAALRKKYACDYDDSGSIGRRYRRRDEVGTPYCVTIDFDTLKDDAVTVRDRDTMKQIRIGIGGLEKYFEEKFAY